MNNDYLLRGFWRDMAMLAAGMTAGAMMTAAVSHAQPPVQPMPVATAVEKNCDTLWNTPYEELSAAEQEARYQCDEAEALVDRWATSEEEEQ